MNKENIYLFFFFCWIFLTYLCTMNCDNTHPTILPHFFLTSADTFSTYVVPLPLFFLSSLFSPSFTFVYFSLSHSFVVLFCRLHVDSQSCCVFMIRWPCQIQKTRPTPGFPVPQCPQSSYHLSHGGLWATKGAFAVIVLFLHW